MDTPLWAGLVYTGQASMGGHLFTFTKAGPFRPKPKQQQQLDILKWLSPGKSEPLSLITEKPIHYSDSPVSQKMTRSVRLGENTNYSIDNFLSLRPALAALVP